MKKAILIILLALCAIVAVGEERPLAPCGGVVFGGSRSYERDEALSWLSRGWRFREYPLNEWVHGFARGKCGVCGVGDTAAALSAAWAALAGDADLSPAFADSLRAALSADSANLLAAYTHVDRARRLSFGFVAVRRSAIADCRRASGE
jgi:hypothetical protein